MYYCLILFDFAGFCGLSLSLLYLFVIDITGDWYWLLLVREVSVWVQYHVDVCISLYLKLLLFAWLYFSVYILSLLSYSIQVRLYNRFHSYHIGLYLR